MNQWQIVKTGNHLPNSSDPHNTDKILTLFVRVKYSNVASYFDSKPLHHSLNSSDYDHVI